MDEIRIPGQDGQVLRKQNFCQKTNKDGQSASQGETQFQKLSQSTCHHFLKVEWCCIKTNAISWIQCFMLMLIFYSCFFEQIQLSFINKRIVHLIIKQLMSELIVKIRNHQRTSKLQRKKIQNNLICYTPPKVFCKNSMRNYYYNVQKQNGYDYERNSSKTMKWMKQQYQEKMIKYLGNKEFVKKQTRMDKVLLKEKLNFKNQVNPLVTIFSKLNSTVQKKLLQIGFQSLC